MKNKLKGLLYATVGIIFWCGVWQLAATLLDKPYLLPDIPATLSALREVLITESFYKTVLYTVLRVAAGLLIGVGAGIILAVLTNLFPWLRAVISPFISIVKATPVATFIMILWVLLDGGTLAIAIAFLMVMPIVWQNVSDGFSAIDPELSEVCDAFGFSYKKKLKLLIIPTVSRYLFPALVTSVGLAWKSEIAAEIIAYTKLSVGAMINDAKYNFETAKMFALTIIVVILSLILESVTKFLIGRCRKDA